MKIWNYSRETHELLGEGVADADPLEDGNWLVPAYATDVEPPSAADGKSRHFDPTVGVWSYQDIPQVVDPTPTAEELWSDYQAMARAALARSDVTILRCVEAGIAVPPEWSEYRRALRAIVGAATGAPAQPLPTRPAFPAGT